MRLAIAAFVLFASVLVPAQTQVYVPDPMPSGGSNGTPFASGIMTYALIVPASALDPANDRILDIAFMPTENASWTAGSFQMGIGHVGPPTTFLSFPQIGAGAVATLGDFQDLTVLYDSGLSGPFTFAWGALSWSPLDLPARGAPSFVWDGARDVGIYMTWTNVATSSFSGLFRSAGSSVRRHWNAQYQATAQTSFAGFGLAVRLTVQPAGPAAIVLGSGCPGSLGVPPVLDTANQPPALGNAAFGARIIQAVPGQAAFLYAALAAAETPFPLGGGCDLYLDLPSLLNLLAAGVIPLGPNPVNGAGSTTWPVPLPPDPALAGTRVAVQGLVTDPGAPGGWTVTNGLDIYFN